MVAERTAHHVSRTWQFTASFFRVFCSDDYEAPNYLTLKSTQILYVLTHVVQTHGDKTSSTQSLKHMVIWTRLHTGHGLDLSFFVGSFTHWLAWHTCLSSDNGISVSLSVLFLLSSQQIMLNDIKCHHCTTSQDVLTPDFTEETHQSLCVFHTLIHTSLCTLLLHPVYSSTLTGLLSYVSMLLTVCNTRLLNTWIWFGVSVSSSMVTCTLPVKVKPTDIRYRDSLQLSLSYSYS